MGFLWFLGYTFGYLLIASVVFLWIYTNPWYIRKDKKSYSSSLFAWLVTSSLFWPVGVFVWGGIFWWNKLIALGDNVIRKRSERKERNRKDEELANRGF